MPQVAIMHNASVKRKGTLVHFIESRFSFVGFTLEFRVEVSFVRTLLNPSSRNHEAKQTKASESGAEKDLLQGPINQGDRRGGWVLMV